MVSGQSSNINIHEPPKPSNSRIRHKKHKLEKLSDEAIEQLISQRNSQFADANRTKRAAKTVGMTMRPPSNIRICSSTNAPCSSDPCRSAAGSFGAETGLAQSVTLNGMHLEFGDDIPQSRGSAQSAINTLNIYHRDVDKVRIKTDTGSKADFTRPTSSGRRGGNVPRYAGNSQSRKSLSDVRTFAKDSMEAHEFLNKSDDQVKAEKKAREKTGMEDRLQGEADKREARRQREEAVQQARESYGTTLSQRRDTAQRALNLARMEEQLGRVRGFTIFSSHAPRLMAYNMLIIMIVLAIILDVHIPKTQTIGNTTLILPQQTPTVMQLYGDNAFIVYIGTIIGAAARPTAP